MLSKATKARIESAADEFIAAMDYATKDWPFYKPRIWERLWSYAKSVSAYASFDPGRSFDGAQIPGGIARFVAHRIVLCYQNFGHNPHAIRYFGSTLKEKVAQFQRDFREEREHSIEACADWTISDEQPPADTKEHRAYERSQFLRTDLGETVKRMLVEYK